MTNENKFLTLLEAAQLLNLKTSRLRYEIFHKSIPHFKIGRSIRFSEKDLISWIMSQKQEPREVANG
jgi:excisionase family DNA binding protein